MATLKLKKKPVRAAAGPRPDAPPRPPLRGRGANPRPTLEQAQARRAQDRTHGGAQAHGSGHDRRDARDERRDAQRDGPAPRHDPRDRPPERHGPAANRETRGAPAAFGPRDRRDERRGPAPPGGGAAWSERPAPRHDDRRPPGGRAMAGTDARRDDRRPLRDGRQDDPRRGAPSAARSPHDPPRPAFAPRAERGGPPVAGRDAPHGERPPRRHPAAPADRRDDVRPPYRADPRDDGPRPPYAERRDDAPSGRRADHRRAPPAADAAHPQARWRQPDDRDDARRRDDRSHRGGDPGFDPPEHAPGSLRLSKRMAQLGLASRREADEWIERGWVRVDGKVVSTLGARVQPEQRVTIDARARRDQEQRVTILLHKPVGHVSGQAEDGHEPAIALVRPHAQWAGDASGRRFEHVHLRGIAPAGRLDLDSSGLLVFTQDGRVAKQLVGEESEVDKEYLVSVERAEAAAPGDADPLPDDALALLRHGLQLDGEPLRPAQVERLDDGRLRFVLKQGKKRQIRRMCEAVGLKVTALERVRIGQVALGELPAGQWRYLRDDETFG